MFSIYMIQNIIDNKIYIGQTRNLPKRWSKHKSIAKHLRKNPQRISLAIKNQGHENFECIFIESHHNSIEAHKAERFYIQHFQSNNPEFGYNVNLGGTGFDGIIPTNAQTDKMSEVQKQISIRNGGTPSIYKGVYFDKTNKIWVARINRKFVGNYRTELAAHIGRTEKLQGQI